MAKAQYRNQVQGIEISKVFGAPKRQTLEAWFKEIRKVIPEVPDPKTTDWMITAEYTSSGNKWINFEMQNSIGEKCVIVVDRQHSFLIAS